MSEASNTPRVRDVMLTTAVYVFGVLPFCFFFLVGLIYVVVRLAESM